MNQNPVIIYVGSFEFPDKNAAALRVMGNAKIFKEIGYEVVFLGIDKTSSRENVVTHYKSFSGFDCWTVNYPDDLISWLFYITNVSVIKHIIEKYYRGRVVAVINYNHPAISQLRTLWWCRKHGIKHIAEITEWYDSSAGPLVWRVVKKIDTALRMYWVNSLEDGLITTSSYLTEFYRNRGLKTIEIPSLYDCNSVSEIGFVVPSDDLLKMVYVCSPLNPKMINKDRSNLKERLDVIISSLYQMHLENYDFQLDVYGNTENEYLEVFSEHTEILEVLRNKLKFYGLTPNKIVRKRVASADFMIFIRDVNRVTMAGFPFKVSESISLGTPIITNTMSNMKLYENSGCIFSADRGDELTTLKKAAKLNSAQKQKLKKHCKESRLFHYSNYQQEVKLIFSKIGIKSI